MNTKLVLLTTFALTSFSAFADTVERVYMCGNDIHIRMADAGHVAAYQSQIGEKQVDRILSIALVLLTTGNDTGFFNPGQPGTACGIPDVRPITVLGIEKE